MSKGESVPGLKAITRWTAGGILALTLAGSASAQMNRRNPGRVPNQGHHAGQWLAQHQNMSPDQRRNALESDPGFRSLPPQRQQQLRNQLERFNGMTPMQQQRTLARME